MEELLVLFSHYCNKQGGQILYLFNFDFSQRYWCPCGVLHKSKTKKVKFSDEVQSVVSRLCPFCFFQYIMYILSTAIVLV